MYPTLIGTIRNHNGQIKVVCPNFRHFEVNCPKFRHSAKRCPFPFYFSIYFFIYDFLIVFVWKICAYFLPFSETAEAAGVFCCDLLAALTVALGYLHARNIKRASYSIQLGSKESPCRIVLLSDIHLGAFVGPKHVRRIADEVNKLDADLIVICGDLIDVNIISWQMMMRWNRSAGNSEG
jgi:hypothetical protein